MGITPCEKFGSLNSITKISINHNSVKIKFGSLSWKWVRYDPKDMSESVNSCRLKCNLNPKLVFKLHIET